MADQFAASQGIAALATQFTQGLALEHLVQGLTHKAQALDTNPLRNAHNTYLEKRNSGLANWAGVWHAVRHEDKSIDPIYTLDRFFDLANKTHNLVQVRLETRFKHLAEKGTYNPRAFPSKQVHEAWYNKFLTNLEELKSLSIDAATWAAIKATSKSERWIEQKANVKLYTALARIGYKNPHQLPKDVQTVADRALKLYTSYEKHALSLYK